MSPYLKHEPDLIMHSQNARQEGGMWLSILGRISSPRKGTTFAISLVNPVTTSLGIFRSLISGGGNDFTKEVSSQNIEGLLYIPKDPLLSNMFDHSKQGFGG